LLRPVYACAASIAVVALAAFGIGFAAAPAWLSILFEPFSLFFLPGFVVDSVSSTVRETHATTVIQASWAFYTVVFWLILEVRARKRTPPRPRPRA
jgi:hypothetical protein